MQGQLRFFEGRYAEATERLTRAAVAMEGQGELAAHLASDHLQAALAKLPALLAEEPDIRTLRKVE